MAWSRAALLLLLLAPSNALAQATRTGSVGAARAATSIPLRIDRVADGAMVLASTGFGVLLELIVRTGELRPQAPVDPAILLSIDRAAALSDDTEVSAPILSDLAVATGGAWAITDTLLSAFSEDRGDPEVYALIYAESAAINWALTSLVKIAVRRPRPVAYREVRRTGSSSAETNSALSFYSGHTALVAGLAGTASYLAFDRDPDGVEPWIMLGIGLAATGFVGWQRVRSGAHFPTDVIAAAIAGGSVGVLVPHLHKSVPVPHIRVGARPLEGGGEIVVGGSLF